MNPFKIKIISIGLLWFLILSNSIIALDELSVKMLGADETSSLLLHDKCQPVGLVLRMVPDVQGFFNVTPVNEAMFRKKAVELNANTVQPLFSHVENINGNVYTRYAFVRFWNCM